MIINIFVLFFFFVSVILCFRYKFIHLKFISHSLNALKTSYRNKENRHKAFLLSLGNHIGAGNIVGVCSAILIGGVGTLFWMSFCLFFTSIYSLIENSLGIKFNQKIDGEYRGGSPYYIKNGLKKKKLACLFACLLVLSSSIFFLPVQVNALKESIVNIKELNNLFIFISLLLFSVFILFKGTDKILKLIELIVPFMTLLFVFMCLLILVFNYKMIPSAFIEIFKEAFSSLDSKTIIGSLFGGSISIAFRRSIFSNEAGIGTAPSFNSMVNNKALEQGYLQVFACFIDTTVMCTLFGLVIIVSGIDYNGLDASKMSILIFESFFNFGFGKIIGSLFLFVFSLATIIGSFYSGETNILFFSNKKVKRSKNIYRILFIICLFIGVFFKENKLWDLVDYGIVLFGFINVFALISMRKDFEKMVKENEKFSKV